jgi:hypothetical protein
MYILREENMKVIIILVSFITVNASAKSWLDDIQAENKQQQIDLRWGATGGEADLRFMYEKLKAFNIQINPAPEFPKKHWSDNHLIFPINPKSSLKLQTPYGVINKVTSGKLEIQANISLNFNGKTVAINSLTLVPKHITNKGDMVNFDVIDDKGHKLFDATSIHIELDLKKNLLKMSNIDLSATKTLAQLLQAPLLENQVIAQLHTYNHLNIPKGAITSIKNIDTLSCASNPIWPPAGDVDVQLIAMTSINYMYNVGADQVVLAPSASLKNIGTADVAWYDKFSGSFPPYNTDQHPYLNWFVYREIDGRFEQIALSGIKHAFFTINTNCACPGGHVLGLGCEDVYGIGNNDSSSDLGPRDELNASTGVWENCGSYFDPKPCSGSQQQSSNATGQNRLKVFKNDLGDVNNTSVYFSSWYVIRDDIDIFNSMGYRSINPVDNGGSWSLTPLGTFKNGPALDNYVPKNSITATQSSQTINHNDGHYTVAVKVADLGNGLYRYNYAVENYDFDPRFLNFHIALPAEAQLSDTYFNDPDHNIANDWQFTRTNDVLNIIGSVSNEQDWGMLFSFSYTTDSAPELGVVSIDVAEPLTNAVVSAQALVSSSYSFDVVFKSGFE